MANEQFLAFPEDFPDIHDRSRVGVPRDRVWMRSGKITQASEFNEEVTILEGKIARVGDMTARSGDRQAGADIVVQREDDEAPTGTLILASGRIYIRGDVRPVTAAEIEEVPMVGDVIVGVRVVSTLITHEQDATLVGLAAGTAAEGEAGGIRQTLTLEWGYEGDGGEGDLYQVYLLRDGYVIDQTPPPNLSGVNAAIAVYDGDAHGNYIARGCEVTALGSDGAGNQVFSIAEGRANILGFKRSRLTATRFVQPEEPDLRTVDAEPHTFVDGGGGVGVITVNRPPINGVNSVIVTKTFTETIVRGGVANTSDLLSQTGVTEIVSVIQSGSPFLSGWARVGDSISWAGAGPEPAGGSSYDVTYRYLDAVTPDAISARTITATGGVNAQPAFVSYTYKLPRIDRICLDQDGAIVYLKGISAVEQPQPPSTPATLLSLCLVVNDWFGTPRIINDGTRSIPFDTQWRFFRRLVDMIDLVSLERLQSDISFREPVAKYGVFVDPLTSDRYRDAGEAQTAAVFGGTIQIAIDPTFEEINLSGPVSLDYQEVIVIAQDAATACSKINPYQNFTPPPPGLRLTPARDFWSVSNEQWLSPQTQVFGQGNTSRVVSTEVVTSVTEVAARFLRQIVVSFEITGFGSGETLDELTFDGIDVTPAGPLTANGGGVVSGSFTIPAGVTTGVKRVIAVGGSGRPASAQYTGEGRIETISRQQITTIQQTQVDPPVIAQPNAVIFEGVAFNTLGGNGPDPLAQSFALPEPQHVTAVAVKFCAIGDRSKPVICEIVTMESGFPTTTVLAQARVDMGPVIIGAWQRFVFPFPVFLPASQQFAFVFKTDDADHSLRIAERDGYDPATQRFVGAQPYTVGVLFSSSNAITWTAHQDEDLTMRVFCARFNPTTKIVPLGTIAVTDLSDFIAEAIVQLPTGEARLVFEATAGSEPPVRIEPGQVWERQSYFTGNVVLKAILTGSAMISPVMGRDVLAILGKMRSTGTYISRAFDIGTAVNLKALMKTRLPAGSTIDVDIDKADDDWDDLTQTGAQALADGTLERTFEIDPFTAQQGRLKIELNGTPAARPAVSDLRAWTI